MHGKAQRRRENAAMLCADVTGLQATIDRYMEKETTMAMAGGMTSAYKCSVSDHQLTTTPTTYPRDRCANVEAALVILARGEACIVASADIPALRARLLAEQVR